MADLMLNDLETDQELDHKALAKLIGGCYGKHYKGGHIPKRDFYDFCGHHYHYHHHRYRGHGHYKKYRQKCHQYYEKNWKSY